MGVATRLKAAGEGRAPAREPSVGIIGKLTMKTKHVPLVLSFAVLWSMVALLTGCRESGVAPAPDESADPATVVATVGDYTITKGELIERLRQEVRPQRDMYSVSQEPVTAESVLRDMMREKAMILEGRQLGYPEDDSVATSVGRFRRGRLIQAFVNDYIEENVPVEQAEIDQKTAADPNLSPEQARMQVLREKVPPVYKALYAELLEKFEVQKIERNFARAAQIHQRLLTQPAEPRGRTIFWITNHQIQNELSRDERDITLATFKGGQFTLYDWFKTLNEIAPPGRSKDLSTPAGVEKLLDRGLEPTILEAEAVARGYHQKEELAREIRAREDMTILGKVRMEKYKEVTPPTDEEIRAFFDQNPERFAQQATAKIDQIWCKDLETAQQVKKALEDGAAFETVKADESLRPEESAHNASAFTEGVFWDDLSQGEPNDLVGPVKGFFDDGIKWRIVKILEKTPAEVRPYSDAVKNQVQSAITSQRSKESLERYGASLLEKYPHQVYPDRIEDIDPLQATPVKVEPTP